MELDNLNPDNLNPEPPQSLTSTLRQEEFNEESIAILLTFVSKTLKANIHQLIVDKHKGDKDQHKKQIDNLISTNQIFIVAILDVSGFSSLVSRWDDKVELVAERLNDMFEMMIHCVEDSGGDVISFIGDALICVWRPESNDQHHIATTCAEAANAALEITQELSSEKFKKNKLGVHAGIGIGKTNLVHIGADDIYSFFINGEALEKASTALNVSANGQVRWNILLQEKKFNSFLTLALAFTSPHLTSPHLTSPHLTSPHLPHPPLRWSASAR